MVKGVTRQVVMVRAPGSDLFEQAIFLIRADAAEKSGVTEQTLLRQAKQAAERYTGGCLAGGWRAKLLYSLLGAGGVGLLWLLTAVF